MWQDPHLSNKMSSNTLTKIPMCDPTHYISVKKKTSLAYLQTVQVALAEIV